MKKISILGLGILLLSIILFQCLTFTSSNPVIIIDPPTPVNEYQVMITLGRDTFDYKAVQSDGSDIRVVDIEGNMLPFWIENWNPYGISTLWVRIQEAGTDRVRVTSNNNEDTPGSDGTRVFDPITWENFKDGWFYSGIQTGMVSGWEYPLTEFEYPLEDWQFVAIDTDFVDECEHSRWFVRREFFIAQGEISFSGKADDDFVWTLINADELYRKIGGDESDSDGKNGGEYTGTIVVEEPFGHFIWAGRGQEGIDQELLTISRINSGMEYLYTRKIIGMTSFDDEVDKEGTEVSDTETDPGDGEDGEGTEVSDTETDPGDETGTEVSDTETTPLEDDDTTMDEESDSGD